MKTLGILIFTLCASLAAAAVPTHAAESSQKTLVIIGAADDVLADYRAFMAGREPGEITDYSGPNSRRDVVEVILFQQALALGGLDAEIKFKPVPTYRRLGEELLTGTIAGAGTSFWLTDLERDRKRYFITEPVIENGEFEAGLYTAETNAMALSADSLDKVRVLTAASNRYWTPDWKTLTALGLRGLHHIQDWKTMVRMVANQRADFLLAPFQQNDGMRLIVGSDILVPIPGIKVGLTGSRHFAISRQNDNSDTLFKALQRGLTIMKKQGTLSRAYRQSGFFNVQAKNWKCINPFREVK